MALVILAEAGQQGILTARALSNKKYLQSLMIKGMIIHDDRSLELSVFLLNQESEMLQLL